MDANRWETGIKSAVCKCQTYRFRVKNTGYNTPTRSIENITASYCELNPNKIHSLKAKDCKLLLHIT